MITKPLVMTDAKIVEQKINHYFEQQDKAGKPYTMIGLAIGLGLNHRKMLDVYANLDFEQDYLDKYKNDLPLISNLIKNAKAKVEEYVITNVMTARNPAGGIFIAKNMDYCDKQQIDANVTGDLTINITVDDDK